ncbi:hypothetical protein D3C72_2442500 [compost metagenome]
MKIQQIGHDESKQDQQGQTGIKQIAALDDRGMNNIQGHIIAQVGIQGRDINIA